MQHLYTYSLSTEQILGKTKKIRHIVGTTAEKSKIDIVTKGSKKIIAVLFSCKKNKKYNV